MKRSYWLLIPLVPLLFVSCDRQTAADLVLSLAFNTSSDKVLTQQATNPVQQTPGLDQLGSAVLRMREMQRASAHQDGLRNKEMRALIDRITELAESLGRKPAASETEVSLLAEIRWLAMSAGAEIFPDAYGRVAQTLEQQLFGRSITARQAGSESAKRFIRGYLVQQGDAAETVRVLSLHALAYPDCEMNVELYVTTTEQLANQQQVQAAVRTSKQGLQRCAQQPDVGLLQEHLERIYAEHPGVPGVPMNFAGPLMDGMKFELESTRGKPVLVVFWATWCPACRDELPMLRELHLRYRDEGLQTVGVSLDKDRSQLQTFIETEGLNWPHVFTDQPSQMGWDNPIAKYYGVRSIPSTFLLDSNGVVVAAGLQGDFEIETAILDLQAQP